MSVRPSPAMFLLPCLAGMGAGLWWDTRAVLPEALVALCTRNGFGARMFERDLAFMPATHAWMWLAALVAIACCEWHARIAPHPRRLARLCVHAACLCAMSIGMSLGGWLAASVASTLAIPAFAGLALAMAGGMLLGAVPAAPLYRRLER